MFRPAIQRLEHDDARKLRQRGFCPLPDPDRDIFRRGVFEPLDIVQITMVELVEQGLEGRLDREKIRDKAGGGIDGTLKPQFHAIGMPVQPAAPVPFGHIRQKARRLETERLRDLHKWIFMASLRTYEFAGSAASADDRDNRRWRPPYSRQDRRRPSAATKNARTRGRTMLPAPGLVAGKRASARTPSWQRAARRLSG